MASPHDVKELAVGWNEASKFNANGAKIRSFRPRLENGRLELSSFCVDGLAPPGRWSLLDEHSDKPVVARSEFTPEQVRQAGLQTHPDWDPPRHVNLIGWPGEEERQKDIQQELVRLQRFMRR